MNSNNPNTYTGQLVARAAEMLPGVGQEERLELLAALDPDEMAACMAFIVSQYPTAFDHSLVRDRQLVMRLCDRLDDAAEDEDDLEPYCGRCGAKIGIFSGLGPEWRHYRIDAADYDRNVLLEDVDADHAPVVSWAPVSAEGAQ